MPSIPIPTYTLNTGAKIPAIGFGTYAIPPPEAYKAVTHALKVGYRHIDTAAFYGNEAEVGRAIRESGIPREEIFVTTKLAPSGFRDIKGSFETCFNNLNIGYIDLFLMHWPLPLMADRKTFDTSVTWIDGYVQMQDLPKSQVRAIGVCSTDSVNMKALLSDPRVHVVPAANQCELHPNLAQNGLLATNKSHGILTESYSCLAKGAVNQNPILLKIAEKHGVNAATVAVSWAIARGTVALVKSVTPERIESNFKIISLDAEDMAAVAQLAKEHVRLVNPWPVSNMFHDEVDSK